MSGTTTVDESDVVRGSNATVIYEWTPITYPPLECDEFEAADLLTELGDAGL